jgi:predicted transcriptional regulator
MATFAQKLSPIQVHLLRFFSERKVNDQETNELQQLIANFYAQKADKIMENLWQEKGFTNTSMLEILEKDLRK